MPIVTISTTMQNSTPMQKSQHFHLQGRQWVRFYDIVQLEINRVKEVKSLEAFLDLTEYEEIRSRIEYALNIQQNSDFNQYRFSDKLISVYLTDSMWAQVEEVLHLNRYPQ